MVIKSPDMALDGLGEIDLCVSEEMTLDLLFGDRYPEGLCIGEYSLLKFKETETMAVYSLFEGDVMMPIDLLCQDGCFHMISDCNDDFTEVVTVGDLLRLVR